MATMPAILRKAESGAARPAAGPRPVRDPYQLRALPLEDVFFYSKKIDNSRLEREADPKARGACWSAIGAACLALGLLTSVLAPSAATTLAGYKLEALKAEERRLLNEQRVLQLQEAGLLSPARLENLAKSQNLVTPASGQTLHLEGKSDGKMALNKKGLGTRD
jgi:cell division protein FtsL